MAEEGLAKSPPPPFEEPVQCSCSSRVEPGGASVIPRALYDLNN